MSEENPVLTEVRGPILIITLNRPEAKNAANLALSKGVAAGEQWKLTLEIFWKGRPSSRASLRIHARSPFSSSAAPFVQYFPAIALSPKRGSFSL